jgi:hypothetical protein
MRQRKFSMLNFQCSMLSLVLIASFFLLSPISSVSAQGIPGGATSITITASTDNPTPGQIVTITAVSYSFDINSATVIWTVDSKQVQKGIGMNAYDVKAPTLGKKTTVTVSAVTPDGVHYANSLTLGSGSVDMIIETDGYTPPFFRGKTPLVFQNTLTVIALPHIANTKGVEYDPASLIYQWKKDDGTVIQDQSGYGKQSISIKGNIVPRPYYLIVTASTRDGSGQAQGLIQITATSPGIVFYKTDPLYGPLWNTALGTTFHIGSQKEATVFAGLFGFTFSKNIARDLSLSWMINNIEHTELSANTSVSLRTPPGASGTSRISLDVRGVDNILQQASGGLTASFDESSATGSSTPITF